MGIPYEDYQSHDAYMYTVCTTATLTLDYVCYMFQLFYFL